MTTNTDTLALEALLAVSAQQERFGVQANSGRFMNERIEFYRSNGLSDDRALRLAREDRAAQY